MEAGLVQEFQLLLKPRGMTEVVRVHARNDRGASFPDRPVRRPGDPGAPGGDHPQAPVLDSIQCPQGVVRGSVIDHHALQVPERGRQRGFNRPLDGGFRVECGDGDGKARHVCGAL